MGEKRLNEKRFSVSGKVYVFFQLEENGPIYYVLSEDNERTWSKPQNVSSAKG